MTTSKESAGHIAKGFAEIEKDLRKHCRIVNKMRPHFQNIERNGEVGTLAPMAAYARLKALTAGNLATMLDEHLRETREAQAGGIDPNPIPAEDDDGDDIGVFSSGGGR